MKPAPFSYHRTRSGPETVALLAGLGDGARILEYLRPGPDGLRIGALLGEFCYDENGQPQSATFMDYRMPIAAEVPPINVLITEDSPAPGNPLGLAGSVGRLPLTPARVQELATNGGGR